MGKYLVMVYKNNKFEIYRETETIQFIPMEKMEKIKEVVRTIVEE